MTIADSIAIVQDKIARAAVRSGRAAEAVTLVAVSKQKSVEGIQAAYDAGVRHFGENRAYELQEKAELIALPGLQWHFVGHLQKRQARPIADYAHLFHAVDRYKIAKRLSGFLIGIERTLPALLEVNISGEETKAGFNCAQWETNSEQLAQLYADIEKMLLLPQIEIGGLMTMAPWGASERDVRAVFQRTRALAEKLQTDFPQADWSQLSMGMTDDYEIAIEEGATQVRVGRGIFGARYYG